MSNKILYIKSVDRSEGSPSQFSLELNQFFICNKFKKVSLVSCQIPNLIYNINSYNQYITLYENLTNKLVTLTVGNYNINDLVSHLKTQLDSASGGFNTFTVSNNTNTAKITITAGNNFQLLFSTGNTSNPYRLLGFTSSDGKDAIDTTLSTSTTSTVPVNLVYTNYIGISIDILRQKNIFQKNNNMFNFIIPIDVNFNEMIIYETNKDFSQYNQFNVNIDDFKILNIQLFDSNNRILNLNNEFEMVLKFE